MNKFFVAAVAILCAGCSWTESVAKNYRESAAEEVNKLAFNGSVKYTICFCDKKKNPDCKSHHGAYFQDNFVIHIAPEWYWEPYIYFKGEIAHEMIHAYLDQTRKEFNKKQPHSWLFQQERARVAKALDIPEWAIPDGKKSGDKLDATMMMAVLDRMLQASLDRVHGICRSIPVESPGWPTSVYDPEDWRDIPPPDTK